MTGAVSIHAPMPDIATVSYTQLPHRYNPPTTGYFRPTLSVIIPTPSCENSQVKS